MSTKIILSPNAIRPSDQQWMIDNGLHRPFINIDRTVFRKTADEKAVIKIGKTMYKQKQKSNKTK